MAPTPPNEGMLSLLSFAYEAQILAGPDKAILVDVRHTRERIIWGKERSIGPPAMIAHAPAYLRVRAKNRWLVHVMQPHNTYRLTGQALHKALFDS
jgi:hypothetical protein